MGVKKKSKVTAEFNMSSLTDIIFLLLIFFMLTSSLVTPNALNLQLPGKKSSNQSTSTSNPEVIKIERNGLYYWGTTKLSISGVEKNIKNPKEAKGKNATITISPDKKSSNEAVVPILDAAYRYGINVVLTEPR